MPAFSISDLHARLLSGEAAAVEQLANLLLPRIERRLRSRFGAVDPALVSNAAEDALLEYLRGPSRFDGKQGVNIEDFIALAAKRNLLDLIRRENRRGDREPLPDESFFEGSQPGVINPKDPAVLIEAEEDRAADDQMQIIRQHLLEEFARTLAAPDLEFLKLMVLGERSCASYAQVLGIAQKPTAQQRRCINLSKKRLLRRLQRWVRKRKRTLKMSSRKPRDRKIMF